MLADSYFRWSLNNVNVVKRVVGPKFKLDFWPKKDLRLFLIFIILLLLDQYICDDRCFCKLNGQIDDCCCSVESVDKLNVHIFPRITSLVTKSSYFKYFKVNLDKGCPFWPDDSRCAIKDCAVDVCSEDEVPIGISKFKGKYSTFSADEHQHKEDSDQCAAGELGHLGDVNASITDEQLGHFEDWTEHDDSEHKFCDVDGLKEGTGTVSSRVLIPKDLFHPSFDTVVIVDSYWAATLVKNELGPGMKYVDLTLNPEKYTGYSGFSARRIWNSIYKENCFVPQTQKPTYATLKTHSIDSMCLERRVFYRAISGMHASINIHLSYNYLLSGPMYGKSIWGPNLKEFRKRFSPETTDGLGPTWLKNLYTTYLLVLRAITKAKPYWEQENFYTGNKEEDRMVKELVLDIVKSAMQCPSTFDETLMFSGDPKRAKDLKEEFRSHFYNITQIMDCVGCDKCRLWGKLQTQGLGTALKILFSSDNWKTIPIIKGKRFKLSRIEIVALFNALGRFSSSVHSLRKFKEMK